MIEIRYRRILFFQALFLFLLGTFIYNFFKKSFGLHVGASFWSLYLLSWLIFIVFNLLFIKFFALPSKGLLKKLEASVPEDDLSWSVIEDSLSKRDVHHQILQSEYEIESLKYKILLDSLHDPVCIFNKDEVILYSNQAFNNLFALPENTQKASLLEVTRNLYFQDFVKKSIESSERQKISEFSFDPIQDSFKKFYEITVFPLKNIQNYLCIMHDVTERKMADQMREDFVSNFSHEVRTPLTILNAQMQTLKNTLEKHEVYNPHLKSIFEKIDNNSRRLIGLFNDLLQLTSVEKRKDLNREDVLIEMLALDLSEEMALKYPQKKISFRFDFKVPELYVDYKLFEQVMINLIDNAIKYSKETGDITLSTYSQGNMSVLEIHDSGPGIPEDQQHRIFERFFRVDSSRSSEIEGTGLGLSIVKHIVQKHEGKIKVTSELGKGTSFILYFPNKHSS